MIVEIQVNKTKKEIYAMDENWRTVFICPCSIDFYEGYNEYGEPYCNALNGTYDNNYMYAEAKGQYADEEAYGWGYLDLGDGRGHAIHGGGSNLGYPQCYDEFQPLLPTLGCFRVSNIDAYYLALQFNHSLAQGKRPVITVVEEN